MRKILINALLACLALLLTQVSHAQLSVRPIADSLQYHCYADISQDVLEIRAEGTDIHWYADVTMEEALGSGANYFIVVPLSADSIEFHDTVYITQTQYDTANSRYLQESLPLAICIAVGSFTHVDAILQDEFTLYVSEKMDTYQWYKDSVLVEGATDRILLALESGIYYCVYSRDSCVASSSSWYAACDCTGLRSDMGEVKVYPNPVQDVLTIQSSKAIRFRLLDDRGNSLVEDTIKNELTISLKSYSPGIYFLELLSSQGRYVERLVKE